MREWCWTYTQCTLIAEDDNMSKVKTMAGGKPWLQIVTRENGVTLCTVLRMASQQAGEVFDSTVRCRQHVFGWSNGWSCTYNYRGNHGKSVTILRTRIFKLSKFNFCNIICLLFCISPYYYGKVQIIKRLKYIILTIWFLHFWSLWNLEIS